MNLQRPSFPNDYACLSKELPVVPYYLKLIELETKLATHKAREKELRYEADAYQRLLKLVQDGFTRRLHGVPTKPEARLEELNRIGQLLVQRETSPTALPQKHGREIDRLFLMYCRPDTKLLLEEWGAMFGKVDTKAVEEISGAVGGTSKALNKHREKVSSVFVDQKVPDRWRACIAGEAAEAKIDLGLTIVRNFANDWKTRAALFAVPVTIQGTRISSLPEPYQTCWREAYTALSLETVPKRLLYEPLTASVSQAYYDYAPETVANG